MYVLYGIKNCDTVKKARACLDQRGVVYRFHDFRADGLDEALLKRFVAEAGWNVVLNQRSTSWRSLSEAQKADLDEAKAVALMLELPTLIKRPILDGGPSLIVGFAADGYPAA